MYILIMDITWDPNKAETNFKKHEIRFSDAEMVLYDSFAMTIEDQIVANDTICDRWDGCSWTNTRRRLFIQIGDHSIDFSQKSDPQGKDTI
jgi:uncharacterized DUF497 family protein